MFYPLRIPDNIDLAKACVKGIRKNCRDMLTIPVPFFGVKGIRLVSRAVKKWPDALGDKKASFYLGQFIRMQEEIGTGAPVFGSSMPPFFKRPLRSFITRALGTCHRR
jgi:hypothetical protein